MSDIVDTFKCNGFTATLYYDPDCANPREDDEGKFLFLGFPHRHYNIGDEQLTGDEAFPCPQCGGEGKVPEGDGNYEGAGYHEIECPACVGYGTREASSLDELIEMVGKKYGARLVRPVRMYDHSDVTYQLGRGAFACDQGGWDSGTCGLMVATRECLIYRGGEQWADEATDEQLEQWMASEVDAYSNWASGQCFGYITRDLNGDEVDACWGLIGWDYAEEEAMGSLAACATAPSPPKLYGLRLTEAEIRAVLLAKPAEPLTDAALSAAVKLDSVLTKLEDEG